ncbi:hypothetical protein BDZ89DRAFT_1139734 [Hymenopellis radicata]|nr:hypothetical protein BDZ89DRAFT_1139734 [Hymenopellis radicata]
MAGPGRPRLYKTAEEKREARNERGRRYYQNNKAYVLEKCAERYERKRRVGEIQALIDADPRNKALEDHLRTRGELIDEAKDQHRSLQALTGASTRDYVWRLACSSADLIDARYATTRIKDELTRVGQMHDAFGLTLAALHNVAGGIESTDMEMLTKISADFDIVQEYLADLLHHIRKKSLLKALKRQSLACSRFPEYLPK